MTAMHEVFMCQTKKCRVSYSCIRNALERRVPKNKNIFKSSACYMLIHCRRLLLFLSKDPSFKEFEKLVTASDITSEYK